MFHQIVVHLVIFISFTIDLLNNRSQTLVFAGNITSSKFNGSINVTQFDAKLMSKSVRRNIFII